MAKEYFQDITPPKGAEGDSGRSIRNISTSPNRPRFGRRQTPPAPTPPRRRSSGVGKVGMWLIALISLALVAIAGILLLNATTEVTVIPRTHTVVFDEQAVFTAYPAGDTSTTTTQRVTYTARTQTFEASTAAEATGTELVEDRASGRITVYNEFSEENVRLIKNTRFETPEGLVYRARDSIVIPGYTRENGSVVPGELEITVYADEVGERYNVGPVNRFTLPGLETEPDMFATVYARSTGGMTGGFVGERPRVADTDLAAAQAELRDTLRSRIRADVAGATDETVIFPGLVGITYEELPSEIDSAGVVQVRMRAIAHIPVFVDTEISQYLAAATSADAGESETTILDPSTVVASPVSAETLQYGQEPVDFSLNGSVTFVWNVDTERLTNDLAGRSKDAFETIVGSYSGVEEATARVRPFWRVSFPDNPSEIQIVVATPKTQE